VNQIASSLQLTIEINPWLSNENSEPTGAINDVNDEGKLPETPDKDKFEEIILEAVKGNPYDLSYTCLLLPMYSSDLLLDDVAISLQAKMEQICISFGWQLEFLSIKADYLHWTLRVPPATSTAYFMQVIREQMSRHILADFPRFMQKNPSNDFWAPGYLIFWGSQPHPVEIIQKFIHQTRKHQMDRPDE
jgi:REP element-mobilizing transposase RayT